MTLSTIAPAIASLETYTMTSLCEMSDDQLEQRDSALDCAEEVACMPEAHKALRVFDSSTAALMALAALHADADDTAGAELLRSFARLMAAHEAQAE